MGALVDRLFAGQLRRSPDGRSQMSETQRRKVYVLWPVYIPQKSRRAEAVTVRSAAKTVCSTSSSHCPGRLVEGAMRPIQNNSSGGYAACFENALLHVSR